MTLFSRMLTVGRSVQKTGSVRISGTLNRLRSKFPSQQIVDLKPGPGKYAKALRLGGTAVTVMSIASAITDAIFEDAPNEMANSFGDVLGLLMLGNAKSLSEVGLSRALRGEEYAIYAVAVSLLSSNLGSAPSETAKKIAATMLLASIDPDQYKAATGMASWWETITSTYSYYENAIIDFLSAGTLSQETVEFDDVLQTVEEDQGLTLLGKLIEHMYVIARRYNIKTTMTDEDGEGTFDPIKDIQFVLAELSRSMSVDLGLLGYINEYTSNRDVLSMAQQCTDNLFRTMLLQSYGNETHTPTDVRRVVSDVVAIVKPAHDLRNPADRVALAETLEFIAPSLRYKLPLE